MQPRRSAITACYGIMCSIPRAGILTGSGTPEFFADMTKAFLFDKDGSGPKEKLAACYHGIVKAEE